MTLNQILTGKSWLRYNIFEGSGQTHPRWPQKCSPCSRAVRSLELLGAVGSATPRNMSAFLRAGWLVKQGGGYKSWNKRWFVLTSQNMSYYVDSVWHEYRHNYSLCFFLSASKNILGERPLGSLDLHNSIPALVPKQDTGREWCFCLQSPLRRLIMQASSLADLTEWMDALKRAYRPNLSPLPPFFAFSTVVSLTCLCYKH